MDSVAPAGLPAAPAKILVVSEGGPVALAVAALAGAGYAVGTARGAEEAVALADSLRPAAIVLDARLKGGAALQVARALRRAGNRAPLVAIGGEAETTLFAALVGASAIVAGRPTAAQLVSAIERALSV